MAAPDNLRYTTIPLTHGSGAMPALGFGTLIPDPLATKQATKAALETGFRHFDCSERYRNEREVGDAMAEVFRAGKDSAEGRVRHHEALEQQPPSRAGQAGLRGEPPAAPARRCRLLSHPHPLRLPTRRRAGPEGRARPGHLRFRGDIGGDLAGLGAPGGRGPVQGNRLVERQFGETARDRRSRANQAGGRRDRNPIPISRNGTCSTIVDSRGSYCSPLRHWGTGWSPGCWIIP